MCLARGPCAPTVLCSCISEYVSECFAKFYNRATKPLSLLAPNLPSSLSLLSDGIWPKPIDSCFGLCIEKADSILALAPLLGIETEDFKLLVNWNEDLVVPGWLRAKLAPSGTAHPARVPPKLPAAARMVGALAGVADEAVPRERRREAEAARRRRRLI